MAWSSIYLADSNFLLRLTRRDYLNQTSRCLANKGALSNRQLPPVMRRPKIF